VFRHVNALREAALESAQLFFKFGSVIASLKEYIIPFIAVHIAQDKAAEMALDFKVL
jgi:hypothetical protein